MTTLSTFGKTFQEKLSYLILLDRTFADRMQEVLKIEFLEAKYLQWFVEKIFEYRNEYKVHPAKDTVESIILSKLPSENEIIQKQVRDYYARIVSVTIDDADFIKKESLDFCRKQKLHEAMLESTKLIKSNSFEQISTIINAALKAGAEVDSGHDFIKDFEKRYVENVRNPIPTGWSQIDEITSGGLGRGEYGFVIAPTGAGKTFFLVHLGAEALKKGLNVVFYSLELSAEVIGLRFDACLSGIPIDELRDHKEEIFKTISGIPGKLVIKRYPKKTASFQTIRLHLETLKSRGFVPDMIIVDYLEILKAVQSKKELRHEIGDSYDEFEAICQEQGCVGWTASQTNRSGVNSDLVTTDEISEAFNKCFGSYLILTLTRKTHDKQNNTGKIFVAKNRNGPDGVTFDVFMDPAIASIRVIGTHDDDSDSLSLVDEEEDKRRLREKYKKFKEKQNRGN
jgi:replicative DNA helicase